MPPSNESRDRQRREIATPTTPETAADSGIDKEAESPVEARVTADEVEKVVSEGADQFTAPESEAAQPEFTPVPQYPSVKATSPEPDLGGFQVGERTLTNDEIAEAYTEKPGIIRRTVNKLKGAGFWVLDFSWNNPVVRTIRSEGRDFGKQVADAYALPEHFLVIPVVHGINKILVRPMRNLGRWATRRPALDQAPEYWDFPIVSMTSGTVLLIIGAAYIGNDIYQKQFKGEDASAQVAQDDSSEAGPSALPDTGSADDPDETELAQAPVEASVYSVDEPLETMDDPFVDDDSEKKESVVETASGDTESTSGEALAAKYDLDLEEAYDQETLISIQKILATEVYKGQPVTPEKKEEAIQILLAKRAEQKPVDNGIMERVAELERELTPAPEELETAADKPVVAESKPKGEAKPAETVKSQPLIASDPNLGAPPAPSVALDGPTKTDIPRSTTSPLGGESKAEMNIPAVAITPPEKPIVPSKAEGPLDEPVVADVVEPQQKRITAPPVPAEVEMPAVVEAKPEEQKLPKVESKSTTVPAVAEVQPKEGEAKPEEQKLPKVESKSTTAPAVAEVKPKEGEAKPVEKPAESTKPVEKPAPVVEEPEVVEVKPVEKAEDENPMPLVLPSLKEVEVKEIEAIITINRKDPSTLTDDEKNQHRAIMKKVSDQEYEGFIRFLVEKAQLHPSRTAKFKSALEGLKD